MGDVLYTIAPIYQEENKDELNMKMVQYKNTQVLVQPVKDDQYQIVQLCSTNPQDFLDPQLQPGVMIDRGI